MIVCKFGGTSVAGLNTAKKIKEISESDENRKMLVVSALGKSEKYNYKITDKLFELYFTIRNNKEYLTQINEIFLRYDQLSRDLNVFINWEYLKNKLIKQIKSGKISKEYIVSRGEYFSALLYAKYLKAQFLDASKYIIFNKNGEIDEKNTKKRLNMLNFNKKYVIGGFYGATIDGEICIFDRGGSDITGAIICKLLNFEIYENYTDVCGVFNKNPNIFFNSKKLHLISYKTAIIMANCGNEVVHEKALIELKDSNSLLIVKSTENYKKSGTIIIDNGEINKGNLYVCTAEMIVAEFCGPTKNFVLLLKRYVNFYKIIKNKDKYLILIKDMQMKEDRFIKIFNPTSIYMARIFTIFSDIKISDKNLKNIKKIKNKLKKYGIILINLAKNNNFCIISAGRQEKIVIDAINEYLQNG